MAMNEFHDIQIENLLLDPKNPRIPPTVNGNEQKEILKWMITDGSIIELMGSIGTQGYFPGEPLLAIPSETEKGKYIVVEGNRRLAATMFLNDPELANRKIKTVKIVADEANVKPKELPVLVYQKREEILKYLGYRHVTGVKQWEPLAKAKYIKQLYDLETGISNQEKIRAVAKTIGSRSDYIGRILVGLALYEQIVDNNFFGLRKVDEENIEFSLLTTSITYNSLVDFLGLASPTDPSIKGINLENLKLITQWLFEPTANSRPRIGESRNIRELSMIVKSPQALAAFNQGNSLTDAVRLTEDSITIYRESVRIAKQHLITANSYLYMCNPETGDQVQIDLVLELVKAINSTIKSKLLDEE